MISKADDNSTLVSLLIVPASASRREVDPTATELVHFLQQAITNGTSLLEGSLLQSLALSQVDARS